MVNPTDDVTTRMGLLLLWIRRDVAERTYPEVAGGWGRVMLVVGPRPYAIPRTVENQGSFLCIGGVLFSAGLPSLPRCRGQSKADGEAFLADFNKAHGRRRGCDD